MMAVYADKIHLRKTGTADHSIWTKDYRPGADAPRAGIYRCRKCGVEIGIAEGHTLPPTDDHHHKDGDPILWRLIVRTSKLD